MKRISFNKGKDFYSIELDKNEDRDYIYSRLNKKTWDNIVDKMDSGILIKGFTSTTFIEPHTSQIKDRWMYMLECYLEQAKEDLIL